MNLLTPVPPALLRSLTVAQPITPQPGTRTPEVAIARFQRLTREGLASRGIFVGPPDPAKPLKDWIDVDAPLDADVTYTVLSETGVQQVTLKGADATRLNLPGETVWPEIKRMEPSGVTYNNGESSGTIAPEYLSTDEEVAKMLSDLGGEWEKVGPATVSPAVSIQVAPGETRYPWVVWHKTLKHAKQFPVGKSIHEQVVGTAKSAPGKWKIDEQGKLVYIKDVVPTTTATTKIRVPVVDLPDNAVVEYAAPFGDALQVYVPEAHTPTGEVTLDMIYAEVRALRADVKARASNPWE